jgi:hypothetical protein
VFAALVAEVASDNAVGRTQCYLMHGDTLEHSSAQPSGDDQHGYAEQLLAPAICVRRGSSCAGVPPLLLPVAVLFTRAHMRVNGASRTACLSRRVRTRDSELRWGTPRPRHGREGNDDERRDHPYETHGRPLCKLEVAPPGRMVERLSASVADVWQFGRSVTDEAVA